MWSAYNNGCAFTCVFGYATIVVFVSVYRYSHLQTWCVAVNTGEHPRTFKHLQRHVRTCKRLTHIITFAFCTHSTHTPHPHTPHTPYTHSHKPTHTPPHTHTHTPHTHTPPTHTPTVFIHFPFRFMNKAFLIKIVVKLSLFMFWKLDERYR